jgi:predicted GTPase
MEEQVKRIIKIIIFALPNKYYKMAATEIAERFCDTIYKNQEDIEKYPRKEIIEIVENYLTNHLNAEDTEEQKRLIIKTNEKLQRYLK